MSLKRPSRKYTYRSKGTFRRSYNAGKSVPVSLLWILNTCLGSSWYNTLAELFCTGRFPVSLNYKFLIPTEKFVWHDMFRFILLNPVTLSKLNSSFWYIWGYLFNYLLWLSCAQVYNNPNGLNCKTFSSKL